jgi:hypothetical protein
MQKNVAQEEVIDLCLPALLKMGRGGGGGGVTWLKVMCGTGKAISV